MKKVSVLLVCVALTGFLTACGKQPTEEINAAKASLESVVAAGGEKYAPEETKRVSDAMNAAIEQVNLQGKKLFKNYDLAKQMFTTVKTDADGLKVKVEEIKETQRKDASDAFTQATAAVEEAKALLANAPVGKGSQADIDAMKADLAAIEEALPEVSALIEGGDYLVAQEKAFAIRDRAAALSDEVKKAQEKLEAEKAARKKKK